MEIVIIGLILLLSFILVVVGFWQMFVYFKLSLARRNNSREFNGIQTAEAIFEKLGDNDIKVGSSFWSLTYVRYSKSTKTLKLGRIDSRRKSLWTVAASGRQAYAAHVIEMNARGEKPPISIFWFKLQTYWFNIGFSMFLTFTIGLIFGLAASGVAFGLLFFVGIISLFTIRLIYSIAALKTSKLMISNIDSILCVLLFFLESRLYTDNYNIYTWVCACVCVCVFVFICHVFVFKVVRKR